MHCRDIRKKLSAWSDAETNQRLSGQIQEHLSICPECSRVLQEIANLRTLFQQSPVPPLPEAFAGEVMQQVRSLAANRSETFQPLLWWRDFAFPLKAASAVAFGLVLSLGIYMGESLTRGNSQTTLVSSASAADAVVSSMVQPFAETGVETIADAYLALTVTDKGGR
jgi:anti-sigma factor RsiW